MEKETFSDRCCKILVKVPKGRVTTYKEIAKALHSKAYRAVGNAMNQNPNAPRVPCHRCVQSNGGIGGYAFGKKKKIEMLKKEGVGVVNGRIVDFDKKLIRS